MYPVNTISTNYIYGGWSGHISYSLPHQGWKIHISAIYEDYQIVLNHVAFLSKKFNFSFKYASSKNLIDSLLDIHGDRTSGGKLITIYPQNEHHCYQLLCTLYRYLKSFHGPIVLSDMQFKETTNISYRYGVFVGESGENFLYHNNEKYLDKKVPYFLLPPFINTDPFVENKFPTKKLDPLWNDITVDNAIKFSFGGGIYLGSYLNKYKIVLKEALYGVGNNTGKAIAKRKNEYRILSILKGEYFPKCLNYFYSQRNYYLITEAILGKTFYDYFSSLGPVVVENQKKEQSMSELVGIIKQISKLISYAHNKNVILRDIKPSNFIVTNENTVFFIDCADSIVGNQKKYSDQVKTPGYTIPNDLYNTFAEDWFKLALLIIDALSGINRNSPPASFTQVYSMFNKALNIQGFSKIWADIITALSQNNIKKFKLLLDDQRLCTITLRTITDSPKKLVINNFLIHKEYISNWLYMSLSLADQNLFDKLSKCDQYMITRELDILLKKFIIKNNMTYLKIKNIYSPYIQNGSTGLAYIILYFCDKYGLVNQLEVLKPFLSKFKGRYVKSADVKTGATGISLLLLYAGIVTKSTFFLKLALSWDEYIDILSFEISGKKVWCSGLPTNKTNYSFYAEAYEIQKFKQLIFHAGR